MLEAGMTGYSSSSLLIRRKRISCGSISFWFQLGVGTLVLLLVAAYFSYFWGRGMASYEVSMGIGSSSEFGYSLGFSTFTMKSGQVLDVEYEVKEWKSGFLTLYVWDESGFSLPKIIDTVQIKQEGRGRHRFQATKPGSYRIEFSPSPDGNRYDFSYQARWQVE